MVFEAAHINWNCPAGRRLDQLASVLPREPRLDITVFGSAPLQLLIESSFVSEDVDIFPQEPFSLHLERFVDRHHLAKDQTPLYIAVCDPLTFKSTVDWRDRAVEAQRHGHTFRIVHPWDVLASKLQRLEEKDLAAFKLVIAKTGHPTAAELIAHLQKAVELFRPRFEDEQAHGDMTANTRALWRELWQTDIDVRAAIIRPALQRMERDYVDHDPTLKARLGNIRRPSKPETEP
jgi:hypothetical protein